MRYRESCTIKAAAESTKLDRFWLLTWTCYGTWLPGAAQGFVGQVRNDDGYSVIHNIPGTLYDADLPALEAYARSQVKGEPVHLAAPEAHALINQYQEPPAFADGSCRPPA